MRNIHVRILITLSDDNSVTGFAVEPCCLAKLLQYLARTTLPLSTNVGNSVHPPPQSAPLSCLFDLGQAYPALSPPSCPLSPRLHFAPYYAHIASASGLDKISRGSHEFQLFFCRGCNQTNTSALRLEYSYFLDGQAPETFGQGEELHLRTHHNTHE